MKTGLIWICLTLSYLNAGSRDDAAKIFEGLSAASKDLTGILPKLNELQQYMSSNTDIYSPLPEEFRDVVEKKSAIYDRVDRAFEKFRRLKIVLKAKRKVTDWQPEDSAKIIDFFVLFVAHSDGPNVCLEISGHLKALSESKIPEFRSLVEKDEATKSAVTACLEHYRSHYEN